MTTGTTTSVRPEWIAPGQAAGFGRALRAEWTKFRSVRGWSIGMLIGALLTIFLGVFASANIGIGCGTVINGVQHQQSGKACLPYVPIGPGGEAVSDAFYFVHQPLAGNGTITVALTSLTGRYSNGNGRVQAGPGQGGQSDLGAGMTPGLVSWAKAGIIIKASTKQGSAYAAMMATGSHGVRMQYNFTGDIAGLPGSVAQASPRWLRLTRSGDTISGYDSADGRHWALVGTVHLAGLPATVQAGLFATSPQYQKVSQFAGGASIQNGPSIATGVFDDIRLQGNWPGSLWTGTAIGAGPRGDYPSQGGDYHQAPGHVTVTGSGDIAPVVPGPGGFPSATLDQTLVGLFIGLIAVVTVAALFVTSEYRRGVIRVTLAATPRRSEVLAAKAAVAGLVAFVVGLVAAIICVTVGLPKLSSKGMYILPVSVFTEARVIVATAAMVAVVAVLALAIGVIMRRSAAAVTTAIVLVVLPFLLAVTVLPTSAANWVLELTPAAGLAVEQSIPHYSQVAYISSPAGGGQYPLPPLAGFGVLVAWTAAALALAVFLLRRRDV